MFLPKKKGRKEKEKKEKEGGKGGGGGMEKGIRKEGIKKERKKKINYYRKKRKQICEMMGVLTYCGDSFTVYTYIKSSNCNL